MKIYHKKFLTEKQFRKIDPWPFPSFTSSAVRHLIAIWGRFDESVSDGIFGQKFWPEFT
jgi:hypothetical protein